MGSWGIVDLIQDKKIRNEDVSRAVIVGGNHSTGLVQMLLLKQRLLQSFLSKDCAKAGFDHDDLQMIRAALSSRDSYRSSVSALPGGQEPDVSWIGRLHESSVKVLRFLEAPQSCRNSVSAQTCSVNRTKHRNLLAHAGTCCE